MATNCSVWSQMALLWLWQRLAAAASLQPVTQQLPYAAGAALKKRKGRKNGILPFSATWMDLGSIMLNEISQIEKGKYHMLSLICGIQKTKQMS